MIYVRGSLKYAGAPYAILNAGAVLIVSVLLLMAYAGRRLPTEVIRKSYQNLTDSLYSKTIRFIL